MMRVFLAMATALLAQAALAGGGPPTPMQSVPDNGSTALLLGLAAAMIALGILRRLPHN